MNAFSRRIVFGSTFPDLAAQRRKADHARFVGLLSRISAQDCRVVSALVRRVVEIEARRGEGAALGLIADIEEVILSPDCPAEG